MQRQQGLCEGKGVILLALAHPKQPATGKFSLVLSRAPLSLPLLASKTAPLLRFRCGVVALQEVHVPLSYDVHDPTPRALEHDLEFSATCIGTHADQSCPPVSINVFFVQASVGQFTLNAPSWTSWKAWFQSFNSPYQSQTWRSRGLHASEVLTKRRRHPQTRTRHATHWKTCCPLSPKLPLPNPLRSPWPRSWPRLIHRLLRLYHHHFYRQHNHFRN